MLITTKEGSLGRKPRTGISKDTLLKDPERVYRQIDKLIEKLEVSPMIFISAIAEPYVDRCLQKNPEYEIEKLRLENEQLRRLVTSLEVGLPSQRNLVENTDAQKEMASLSSM